MKDVKALNDQELTQVTGGEGEAQYKYRLRTNDWVYDNPHKTITVHVEEYIDTNDSRAPVKMSKSTAGTTTVFDGSGIITTTVGHIIYLYEEYGGSLHAM